MEEQSFSFMCKLALAMLTYVLAIGGPELPKPNFVNIMTVHGNLFFWMSGHKNPGATYVVDKTLK